MSGVFPPGTRPDQWGTIGDLQRRVQGLEALPCCFNSGLGPNTTFSDLVIANPCATNYWQMDDVGPGADDSVGALDLAENPSGSSHTQPLGGQGAFSFAYEQSGPWPVVAPDSTSIKFDGNDLTLSTGTLLYTALGAGNPLQSTFSMIGWVYITDTSQHNLWSFYTGTVDSVGVGAGGSPMHFGFGGNNGVVTGSTTVALNTWYFVAATYSAVTNAMKLYVNGVLDASGTIASGTAGLTGTLRFGAAGTGVSGPSGYLNGRQAQCAMFNCVLTAAEIAALSGSTNEPEITADEGMVPVADGSGSYSWEFPLEVSY